MNQHRARHDIPPVTKLKRRGCGQGSTHIWLRFVFLATTPPNGLGKDAFGTDMVTSGMGASATAVSTKSATGQMSAVWSLAAVSTCTPSLNIAQALMPSA